MHRVSDTTQSNIRPLNNLAEESLEHILSQYKKWEPQDNTMLSGHSGAVWSITSTSDNSHIFSGSEDKTIIVWDGVTNSQIGKLEGHTGTVNVLEITPDMSLLISGCWNGLLMIWDWQSRNKSGVLSGHTAGIYCSKILEDSDTLFTGSGDYTAKMWSIKNRILIRSFNCEGNSVFGLTLVKFQTVLICGGWGGLLRVWENIESDVKTKDINPDGGVIQSLTSTPNSLYVIVGTRNNIIIVFDYPLFTQKVRHLSHSNWVRNLTSTADSRFFFSCSADKTTKLFNLHTGLEYFSFDKEDGYLFGLHLSVDGTILYTGASDKILWKRSLGIKDNVNILKGHSKCIMSLSLSSDSRFIISGSEDNTIKIWSLESMRSLETICGHTSTIWGINLTRNMKYIISASGDKTVRVWDFSNKSEVKTFKIHTASVFTVTSSEDSQLAASGGQDKNIVLYDLGSLEYIHTFIGHMDTVFSVKFTESGDYLCSGSADRTIIIWSPSKKVLVNKIETKSGMVESIAITKDSKYLIIGDRGNYVHLWDFENRSKIKTFTMHTKWVKDVCLSYDDNLIASASNDMMIYTYNLKGKDIENSFAGHTDTIRCLEFTNDSNYLVSGGEDKCIRVWPIYNSNIMKVNQFESSLDSFLFLKFVSDKKIPTKNYLNKSISPLKITVCHIYSYEGNHLLLNEALEAGALLKKDALNHSPLFYALDRKIQKCVDTILLNLINLRLNSIDNFLDSCWVLRDDFENLLKNQSIHLPDFLEYIFYESQQADLPRFGDPLQRLPVIKYNEDFYINANSFLNSEAISKQKEVIVEFKVLLFPIPFISGSKASITMLKSIVDNPNKKICRANLIVIIVRSRWSNFWYFILLLTFIYWSNLGIMIWLLVNDTTNSAALAIYAVINIVLLLYEAIQLYSIGLREYFNFWNLCDLARVGICIIWIILSVFVGEENVNWVSYIMVAFNFFRGLTGFRAFDSTRFYVRLIIRAFIDTMPFIVIFFYTTLFFGMLNWASGIEYRTDSFTQIWKIPFELNMGSFNSSNNPDMNYLFFMLTSVINVIIILNLLISILGDSYDRFQAESIEIGNLEMVEIILEIETLMFWRGNNNEKQFIQVCDTAKYDGISNEWEGKLKAIGDLINRNSKVTQFYFEAIKKKFDSTEIRNK